MNFFDVIFLGVYKILDKTIYANSDSNRGIGPKEHAYFVSFLFYGVNLQTAWSYIAVTYFHRAVNFPILIACAVVIFILGFAIYLKGKRAERILSQNISNNKAIAYVLISVAYLIISVYLMIIVGNYSRYHLTGLIN